MKVYELLADPKRWTKWVVHRDANGILCAAKDAACWCLSGAILECYRDSTRECDAAFDSVQNAISSNYRSIPEYNDAPERTHAEVLELVTRLGI